MEHPPPLQNVSAAGPGIDQPLIAYRVLRNAGFYELPRLQGEHDSHDEDMCLGTVP